MGPGRLTPGPFEKRHSHGQGSLRLYPNQSRFPAKYRRRHPVLLCYPDGPGRSPSRGIDFTPGARSSMRVRRTGSTSFLEAAGHTLVVTSDKEGADSVF